ncbi:MAG: hypothetical protein R2860_00135 [Desulfobacterales bacterium]
MTAWWGLKAPNGKRLWRPVCWWSPGCDHINIIGHLFSITRDFQHRTFM